MIDEITNIRNQAISEILSSNNSNELEIIRAAYLGKNGYLTKLIKNITNTNEDKRQIGISINETKKTIETEIAKKKQSFSKNSVSKIDISQPGIEPEIGSLHIITQAIEEIAKVFEKLGFTRARYPEVEWDFFTFEGLNFDQNHPARDDWETFFMDEPISAKYGQMLLTPHTSSGQIREMMRVKNPPIRMINISKTYRRQSDVSHVPMFHQFEGLVIDENISIANLRGTLDYFAQNFFGENRKTRLRPYNFPFTEPSFEIDISCGVCNGEGCKLCKQGWLELGGAGMVHPNVLKAGNIDNNKYTGFAFGWGVERVFMMKSGIGISDIRTMHSTNLDFLKQF